MYARYFCKFFCNFLNFSITIPNQQYIKIYCAWYVQILFGLKLRNIDMFCSFYKLWSKSTHKAHKIMLDFEIFYFFKNDVIWLGKYTYFTKKLEKLIMNKKNWFFLCHLCAYTIYLKNIIYNVERIFL